MSFSSTTIETSARIPTFRYFTQLPQELRDMIWGFALIEETRTEAHVFAMANGVPFKDACGEDLAGDIYPSYLPVDTAHDEGYYGEKRVHYSTLALASSSTRNFSAYLVQGAVEASCRDAGRETARLKRIGSLPTPSQKIDQQQSLEIVLPIDPTSQISPSDNRTVSIHKVRDLVVLVGDFMPKKMASFGEFTAPSPSWALSVPFTWASSPEDRVTHIGIEFDPSWLYDNPDYDWYPSQYHGDYDFDVKCAFTEAKKRFANLWFIDRSIRRSSHGVIPPNRHIFHAKGGRFVEVRRPADGPKYDFSEGEKVVIEPGIWEYQDVKPLDDFRRPNAFCFKHELKKMGMGGHVFTDDALCADLWEVIDRDHPEYRDYLEGLSVAELAELTNGHGRLGVLAWEEGDF